MPEPYTLITGASSDLGRAIAIRLGQDRRLLLAGRDQLQLEAVRQACPNPDGHRLWVQDLERVEQLEGSLAGILALEGLGIDHFIHAAGRLEVAPLRLLDPAKALAIFQVNVLSAMEIARHLSRRRFNGEPLQSLLFLGSIASRVGTPGFHAYAASKGALGALSRSLAVELAPAVRVNCVLPGGIRTRATARLFGESESQKARTLLGPGEPRDVAGIVAFLLSADARWITGQEFVVDGGSSIH